VYRFLDTLTNKRRETQDRLAEKAIEEARKKQDQDAATQQNGSAVSAPVTPATTPTAPPAGIREGTTTQFITNDFFHHIDLMQMN